MNERIKAIARQAITFRLDPDSNCYEALICPEDLELFAELLIREFTGIAYEYDIPNLTGPGEFIGNRIKKHFGVEE